TIKHAPSFWVIRRPLGQRSDEERRDCLALDGGCGRADDGANETRIADGCGAARGRLGAHRPEWIWGFRRPCIDVHTRVADPARQRRHGSRPAAGGGGPPPPPQATPAREPARRRAAPPRGPAFTKNARHAPGAPYIVVSRPCAAGPF